MEGLGTAAFVGVNVTIVIYLLFFRFRPLFVDASGTSKRLQIAADGYLLSAIFIDLIALGVTVAFLVTWDYIHLPLLGFLWLFATLLLWRGVSRRRQNK